MRNKKIIIVMILSLTLLSGCSDDKCVESHTEKSTCVYFSYIYSGKQLIPIPIYYDCEKTVCDRYESEVK